MDPSAPSGELLTRHSGFLRALARGLLGDEQLAEDACQDALLATLRQPPPAHVNPVAWLATLTRRAALGIRRSATRRERREIEVARPEAQSFGVDVVARAEILLRVAEAVVALPEPYRATLLARYYEELTPSMIAARDRVPLATVKSRVTRAHALLRERLDRSLGKDRNRWESDLAALCGLSAKPLLVTAIAMKTSVKVGLIAAALLAIASGAWFAFDSSNPHATAGTQEVAVSAMPDLNVEPAAQPPVQVERTVVAAAPPAIAERALLWGDLRGATSAELMDSELVISDEHSNERTATIGKSSSYSLFGLASGTYRASFWKQGFLPLDEAVIVPSGQTKVRHDFELRRSLVLPVKLVDRTSGELLKISHFDPIGAALGVVATRTLPEGIEGVLGQRVSRTSDGFYHVREIAGENALIPEGASGALEVFAPTPVFASLTLREIVLESRVVTGAETELVFHVDRAALSAKLGTLELRCVEAHTGLPIVGVHIAVEFAGTSSDGQANTDEQGAVHIERLTPGLRTLNLRGDKFAWVERWVRIEPGATLDLGTIELAPTATITGRVRDPGGAGVSASITAFTLSRQSSPRDVQSWRREDSRTDGSFEISWIESARVRLVAEPADWAITTLDIDASSGRVQDLEIRLEPGTEVTVRRSAGSEENLEFLLADAEGVPLLFRGIYGAASRRLLLRPGRYVLSTVIADRVGSTRTIEVGDASSPLTVELR